MANESATAEAFVNAVLAQSIDFKSVTFFAVLDNVSTDRTLDILTNLAKEKPPLRVVWAPSNRCVVDAYILGYREALNAGCNWILEIDAGFSHQPSDMPKFFDKMAQGYDCVFGSRFCKSGKSKGGSLKRYIISRGGTLLTNLLLGTKLSDMTSGFQLFTCHAVEHFLQKGIYSRGHFFQTEIKVHCRNLQITEVPIHYRNPSPSVNNSVLIDALNNLWRLFRLRLAGAL